MSKEFTLEHLLHEIANERGVDFRSYKRSTLERRFRKRMFEVKKADYAEYAAYLRSQPDEVNELLNTVLINVTEFFRDPQAWDVLRRDVLPAMLNAKQPGDTIRCWSAGCASGEEPYSIAILIAEHFGPRLQQYDVKIYGTDIDDDALNVARRAEYSPDRLRRVRPDWRKKYFQGDKILRVNRDLRRLCIFGRSNVVSDAPISHVDLLTCRNVLIYFDSRTQTQILMRLHYALEPNGMLFIGKASSLVGAAHLFRSVNSKYRIFQRADAPVAHIAGGADVPREPRDFSPGAELLRIQHETLLETLETGVLVLDSKNTVISENPSAASLWGIKNSLTGKPVLETELGSLCPDLPYHLDQSNSKNDVVSFQCSAGAGGKARTLSVTLKPIMGTGGGRAGTLLYMEDISPREKLQTTIEELEATGEELQSANEELETTNEELQSANEELETTNEELQSTNEELETTNEELQSLNEELQTANEELATRSKEMDELNSRYAETLERIPWPVMVVGAKLKIDFWNSAAKRLFGFDAGPAAELRLEQLPVSPELRNRMIRRHHTTVSRNTRTVLRNEVLNGPKSRANLNVHFTPLAHDDAPESVLIMFELTSGAAGLQPSDGSRAPSRPQKPNRISNKRKNRTKARRRK
jgi:two-component system CheB/CheR fusion protein